MVILKSKTAKVIFAVIACLLVYSLWGTHGMCIHGLKFQVVQYQVHLQQIL